MGLRAGNVWELYTSLSELTQWGLQRIATKYLISFFLVIDKEIKEGLAIKASRYTDIQAQELAGGFLHSHARPRRPTATLPFPLTVSLLFMFHLYFSGISTPGINPTESFEPEVVSPTG